tara:strand:+ start:924 stop:1319 length:396 start_codon:yes stop_codon:yes gene_type:complete
MHSGNDSIESDPEFGISREKTLDELIVGIEADPYVKAGLRRAEILNMFDDLVNSVLEGVGGCCRATEFHDGILVVEVMDNGWAQKVNMAAPAILEKFNDRDLEERPSSIRVRLYPGLAKQLDVNKGDLSRS